VVCSLCQTVQFAAVSYQDALDSCSSLLGTEFHATCVDDFCYSCGNDNVNLVQANLDAYILHTESGLGRGSWPSGLIIPAGIGDPHLRNVKGEAFDIHTTGWVQMVRIPRGAEPSGAELLVTADLAPIHANRSCSQTFIHMLHINGSRLGGTPLTLKTGLHGTPQVVTSRSGFKEKMRGMRRELERGDITIATFNNSAYPASRGMLHVKVGKYNLVVRQRQQNHFSYFDLDVQGILESASDVGGLLGLDDHDAKVPEHCLPTPATTLDRQEGASLGEDLHMIFNSRMMSTVSLF